VRRPTQIEPPLHGIAFGSIFGKLNAMSATIVLDKAGRIVLPKVIRDRLRLSAGAKLRAEVVGDKLELTQEIPDVKLVKRGKRRVVVGWEGFDAAKAVREMREDQVKRFDAPPHK
jgi:AbrB family looped-hinge helix DNA binding protein